LTRCSIGDGALLAWLKLSKLILPWQSCTWVATMSATKVH
jgi:hypothetical protein